MEDDVIDEFENIYIDPYKKVVVTKTNHIVEVQYLKKQNKKQNIKKLDSDRYVNLDTGEILYFEKSENRNDNNNSLRQTFKKLRYLINNNFIGSKNELFVTLTYAENMTDTERLYFDLDKFLKRLRYKFKDLSTIDYINVVEPQERGAWHCHILFRFNDVESMYISNKELAELWGHGFVRVNRLDENIDNIGAYLTAYLTDIALDDVSEEYFYKNILGKSVPVKEIEDKYYIKGGRLEMYPTYMNLYRCSRGIKKPERIEIDYKDIKKYISSDKLTYSKKIDVVDIDFENTIIYNYYNLKR